MSVELHEYEARIISFIDEVSTVHELCEKSGLEHIKVMRGLQWLSSKELISLDYEEKSIIDLDENGVLYAKTGLPEIRFLKALKNGSLKQAELLEKAGLSMQEIGVSIGTLKKKVAILTETTKEGLVFSITDQGKRIIEKEGLEEQFLKKSFPLNVADLKDEEKFAFNNLQSRKKILKIEHRKVPLFSLTTQGKNLVKKGISHDKTESRLTQQMLKDGSWKNKKFRAFDLNTKVPPIHISKRHYVPQAIEYIKKVWLEMGFTQMEGDMLQSAFWTLDTLFVPQDHPARAMQDTFYIKDPQHVKLPSVAKKIQQVHENGGDTGSLGWRTPWSTEEASQLMLRTHTTVLSAQTIHSLKTTDLPAKFFSVGRVFRNEALDASHLSEFYQVEGIVVDTDANFSNLLGYLKQFFAKLGFPDVRIRPAYFPYTEPSAEVDVWHPVYNKWIELGGSGIFRGEVVKPLLGEAVPVLAWGLGLERSIIEYLGLKDLREIYKSDLKNTEEQKYWMK